MVDEKLKQNLKDLAEQLLRVADSTTDPFGDRVAEGAVVDAIDFLSSKLDAVMTWNDRMATSDGISVAALDEMAVLASEFDDSGDPFLMKQASVIDEILLTIGTNAKAFAAAKQAKEAEIEKIRERARNPETKEYTLVKAEHDRQNNVEEARKAIADRVKDYRPLEAALSTRTCPDHPGAQMGRIAESTYQCSLDKGIYNFQSGYTTMKGNKIPGGDVSNQTQAMHDRPNEFTSFDSRESRLNQS